MSKSGEHDECKRRERELEALVGGQAAEITRLNRALELCERAATRLHLALRQLKRKGTT